jgi:predicted GNAT superfamily acetyltransferase
MTGSEGVTSLPVTDLDRAGQADPRADQAVLAAAAAARAAGLRVHEITAATDLDAAVRLFKRIWRRDQNPPVTTELLRAFGKAGNYVGGAFDGEELVGACVGFFAAPAHEALHSHIAGVAPAVRGRRVGFALKLHQRAWTLLRGTAVIAWTFDPLVSRNAYFNVAKLAADPVEYLPNFYGDMHDGVNGHGDSDRLLVRWRLAAPPVVAACAGVPRTADTDGAGVVLASTDLERPRPATATGSRLLVAVPRDVEALRARDPALATQWRVAVRETLGGLLAGGARVAGFDRRGWYVVTRERP